MRSAGVSILNVTGLGRCGAKEKEKVEVVAEREGELGSAPEATRK
jgi:hypothetical protein